MFSNPMDALRQHVFPRLTLYHLAALLLLSASALANFRYGLELGQSDLEKYIAASASVGADIFNALGLLLVTWAFANRKWVQAFAGTFALICTVVYSANAGIGFAASTKDAWMSERTYQVSAETDRAGVKQRLEAQLAALAPARSANEIQPEMAKILADPRAGDCSTINGKYTKANCPRYFDLQAELGRAETRTKLESQINKLLVTTTAGNKPFVLTADPTGANLVVYLAKLGVHLNPEDIRPWQSLLFVVLVVACGPIALWLAESRLEATRKPVQTQPVAKVDRETPRPTPPPAVKHEAPTIVEKSPKSKSTKLPAAASATLHRLQKAGGKLEASSQNKLAETLKLSRTSMRRAIEALQNGGHVFVDDSKGYALEMIR